MNKYKDGIWEYTIDNNAEYYEDYDFVSVYSNTKFTIKEFDDIITNIVNDIIGDNKYVSNYNVANALVEKDKRFFRIKTAVATSNHRIR